ncbi:MAG: transporter [Mycobacterium sp.]|nr:transporter [Mycobacterium sp.]
MNTGTAIGTYVFGFLVVVLISVVIHRMLGGWRNRAQRQDSLVGTLPTMPDELGPAIIAPAQGLYVGSTLAPDWLERIAVGDLGYRCKAVLTRYPEGILLERSGAGPIWIPQDSITGVRTERGLAGKVLPGDRSKGVKAGTGGGILVIRWRLPSGTEVDTGFRDERRDYSRWTRTGDAA